MAKPLEVYGNCTTMNMNPRIYHNILESKYFRSDLSALSTFHEVRVRARLCATGAGVWGEREIERESWRSPRGWRKKRREGGRAVSNARALLGAVDRGLHRVMWCWRERQRERALSFTFSNSRLLCLSNCLCCFLSPTRTAPLSSLRVCVCVCGSCFSL